MISVIFSCICWQLVCHLGKNVYSDPLPVLNQIVCFLILSCMSSLYILHINLYWVYIYKYLLPFSRLPFCFVDSFLYCAKAILFDLVSFVYFGLCCPWLTSQIQKNIAKTDGKEHTAYVFFQDFYGFRSNICIFNPFWVYFYIWCKKVVQFHSFACSSPVFTTSFIEEAAFLHCIFLSPLS